MRVPLEIPFRGVRKTRDIENLIGEKASKLEQICGYLSSCAAGLERPQEHQQEEESKPTPPHGLEREDWQL
jgi:hypothetical protein